jgi:hypothetical protein
MAVDTVSIGEIYTLIDNYNVILEQYIAANKSLSGLGVYEVLSKKKISGGSKLYSGVIPSVKACQAKCTKLKCSVAAYNTDTKGCQINNNGQVIDGSLTEKVIINKQIYYLNKLDNLNVQLFTINNQIIAKIKAINNGNTLTSLRDERILLNTQLAEDKESLTEQMSSTTSNLMDNTNVLDLEYIQRDEALETNSNYYIFLLLLLIVIIAIVVLIIMQP